MINDYATRLKSAMDAAGVSVQALANHLGVTYQAVKAAINGRSRGLTAPNNARAAEKLGVSGHWLATGEGPRESTQVASKQVDLSAHPDLIAVRRVAIKAQAGVTGYAVEYMGEDSAPIFFRADWYKSRGLNPDKLVALRVAGASMEPALLDGDLIVVNTAAAVPRDGVAYVVSYEGEVVVKRLQRDAGQWWLCSDNSDQRRYPRKVCDERAEIIGEVIYRQTECV